MTIPFTFDSIPGQIEFVSGELYIFWSGYSFQYEACLPGLKAAVDNALRGL